MSPANDPHINRRLAAVAFADVVDFSRHVELDDVRTMARWKDLRCEVVDPLLDEHHGTLLRIIGDGLLIEFHSAVDAVRWAHDTQRQIVARRSADDPDPLRIRIGINVEDVIVEDGDIHGDGVNIAARVQQLAGPDEVVVTSTVRDYVWNKLKFELTDPGEHQLKNISRPVRIFRVDPESNAGGVRRAPAARIETLTRPSVAVLPFRNLGGNPAEDYFGEGITEDIITALSSSGRCSSSRATRRSITAILIATRSTSPANSECATCSRAAYAVKCQGFASRPS